MAEEASASHLLLTVDPIPVPGRGIAFIGPTGSVRFEEPEAASFASTIAVLCDGTRTPMEVMAGLLHLPAADVDRWMAQLVAAGHLVEVRAGAAPAARWLAALGLSSEAIRRLEAARIAVVGPDPVTAQAAATLADFGAQVITVGVGAATSRVQGVLQNGEGGRHPPSTSPADLAAAVDGSAAIVASTQAGFLQSAQWANRAALDLGIPAVFGAVHRATGWAGPLVFPGEGPCLLCYRMRAVACADDFDDAMAAEEWAARPEAAPALDPIDTLTAAVGGIIAVEIVKVITAIAEPVLVGAVCEIDGLSHDRTRHRFLQRRDCPACRKKGRPPRRLAEMPDEPVDLAELAPHLVSRHCGIVRTLEPIPADVTEPLVRVVRCELANNQLRGAGEAPFQPCSGKGIDEPSALRSALGEACERYAVTAWPVGTVRRARPADVGPAALGAEDLVLFAASQYERLPYSPWDPEADIGWIDGVDVSTGHVVAIPAVAALFGYEGSAADQLFSPNSNGLAAGGSFEMATYGAALEVIERDAFVIAWMNRLAGTRIDPFSVESPVVRRLAEAYRRRDVSLELYRLPTDVSNVAVCLAIGVQTSERAVGPGPAVMIGLGADLSETVASAKAVLEVAQVRPTLKARLRDPDVRRRCNELAANPALVSGLEDHDLLFAHPDMVPALSFWRDQPAATVAVEQPGPTGDKERLSALVAGLATAGHRLIVCDLTPPELAVFGIHAAKVVLPTFQPIHFGAGQERLGGRRLRHLPHELGLRPIPAEHGDLNLVPHPLS